jgi:energy-coupling factor transporter ATP-binding protein EcfA2
MKEGVAPASVPWGGAHDAPPTVSAGNQSADSQGVIAASPAPAEAEPHVRVDARKLENALIDLRDAIRRVSLVLDSPGIETVRAERKQLLAQIDDYLIPRLRHSGAPILIALVGSTGAGKSTLLNSIVGTQVSATGIRRPTTNSPVLACHPEDEKWFAENVFLPSMPRVRQQGLAMPGRDGLLVLAPSEGMPQGVAVLDTPDIDSVVEAHRQFARQFLDASDLWLFVTTARRYADAVVWEMLKDGRDRGASLGLVLSRVPPAAATQLTDHFDAMVQANGLGGTQRFVIPETTVIDGRLPAAVSEPVRLWLKDTARRDERRVAILTQTMAGVLDTFERRIPALAAEAEMQLALRRELSCGADAAYQAGLGALDEAIRSGSLLRGEVLARWQDFAGTGDLIRTIEVRKGRPSSKKRRHAPNTSRAQALKNALRTSLEALVVSLADRAAEDAMERWQASPAGVGLLGQAQEAFSGNGKDIRALIGAKPSYSSLRKWEGDHKWGFPGGQLDLAAALPEGGVDALERSSPDLAARVARVVTGWQDNLLKLVQAENLTKRSISRVGSFDADSLALVLTIGVLGYGAGEALPDETGAGAVPQQLLTSLFGAGLMRDIGGQARQDLRERVGVLYAEEALRFTTLVDALGALDESASADLYQASYSLESAR